MNDAIDLNKINKIYFIGICGVSMSSLAQISKKSGYEVAGSDKNFNKMTETLVKNGINVFNSHEPENIIGYDLIVYSSAISYDNPELINAEKLNIPCVKRSVFLGMLMNDERYSTRIGVAGTHGKSTVTAMISDIYLKSGLDPMIINGAEMPELNGAYHIGGGSDFIFEACEYTDSFLDFFPTTAVVLNIDMDHPDYFHSLDQIIDSFKKYITKADMAIVNYDDENIKKLFCNYKYKGKMITYGIYGNDLNYKAENITYNRGFVNFDVIRNSNMLCNIELNVFGLHNVYNSLASIAAAYENGIDLPGIIEGISAYRGIKRRFEYKGSFNGAYIYEDYAHHPAAVAATLESIKKLDFNKIYCVFQPHTYSRTAGLFNDFVKSFGVADKIILLDIYAAREDNTFGVTSGQLKYALINIGKDAEYCEDFKTAAEYIKNTVSNGDIVILMGAGDVNKIGEYIL